MTTASLPIAHLAPCGFNLRDEVGDVGELTATIREHGVLQALVVRPAGDVYEVIVGHRRLAAATEAGLETVPCQVRELTDEQAIQLMLVENLQRADIAPLDEADGYWRLHHDDKLSVEQIAGKVGKSASYVRKRLKLNDLSAKGKKALAAGELPVGAALLLARIPTAKLQDEALGSMRSTVEDPVPLLEARQATQRYQLPLAGAPFDITAKLLARAGACTTCEHRTGNQSELFDDAPSADLCTNPPCYDKKRAAAWKARAAEHKAAGGKVLSKDEAAKLFLYGGYLNNRDYVELDRPPGYSDLPINSKKKWKTLLGKDAKSEVVLAQDKSGNVRELIPRKRAIALAKAKHPELATKPKKAKADPAEAKRRREAAIHRAASQAAIADLVAAVQGDGGEIGISTWRLIAEAFADGSWSDTMRDVLKRRDIKPGSDVRETFQVLIDAGGEDDAPLDTGELSALVIELIVTRNLYNTWGDNPAKRLEQACDLYGVDLAQHRKAAAKRETKSKKGA